MLHHLILSAVLLFAPTTTKVRTVTVSWDEPATTVKIVGYQIGCGFTAGGPYQQMIHVINPAKRSRSFKSLVALSSGATVYCDVTALGQISNSAPSDEASGLVP